MKINDFAMILKNLNFSDASRAGRTLASYMAIRQEYDKSQARDIEWLICHHGYLLSSNHELREFNSFSAGPPFTNII